MKNFGMRLAVLIDIIIAPVTIPLIVIGQFVACAIWAIRYRDLDYITGVYPWVLKTTIKESVRVHIDAFNTGDFESDYI